MAKGQAQAANNQLNKTNAIGAQQGAQASKLEGQLIPDYTSMLNEGYTPAQKAAMTTAGMGAIGSTYGAAQNQEQNEAARTNNASSLTAGQDQLAQEKGVAAGNEAAGLQQQFANEQQANQRFGLQGLSGLYGTNQQSANEMYGLSPGLLQARAAGQNPGLQIAGDLSSAAGAAAA